MGYCASLVSFSKGVPSQEKVIGNHCSRRCSTGTRLQDRRSASCCLLPHSSAVCSAPSCALVLRVLWKAYGLRLEMFDNGFSIKNVDLTYYFACHTVIRLVTHTYTQDKVQFTLLEPFREGWLSVQDSALQTFTQIHIHNIYAVQY